MCDGISKEQMESPERLEDKARVDRILEHNNGMDELIVTMLNKWKDKYPDIMWDWINDNVTCRSGYHEYNDPELDWV